MVDHRSTGVPECEPTESSAPEPCSSLFCASSKLFSQLQNNCEVEQQNNDTVDEGSILIPNDIVNDMKHKMLMDFQDKVNDIKRVYEAVISRYRDELILIHENVSVREQQYTSRIAALEKSLDNAEHSKLEKRVTINEYHYAREVNSISDILCVLEEWKDSEFEDIAVNFRQQVLAFRNVLLQEKRLFDEGIANHSKNMENKASQTLIEPDIVPDNNAFEHEEIQILNSEIKVLHNHVKVSLNLKKCLFLFYDN